MLNRKSSYLEAVKYIKQNYYDIDKHKIVAHICKETRLKADTVNKAYKEVELAKFLALRDKKQAEKENEIRYKGRKRNFFKFDDSNLWRNIS